MFALDGLKKKLPKFSHSGRPRIGSEEGGAIQQFQQVLDPGFCRGDTASDFLRDHQAVPVEHLLAQELLN